MKNMIFIFFIKYRNQALQAFAFINFSMLFLTCNILNRVIRSIHSGSCGAVDEEGQVSLLLVLDHQLLQLLRDHLPPEHHHKVSENNVSIVLLPLCVTCGAYCKMLPPLHCWAELGPKHNKH